MDTSGCREMLQGRLNSRELGKQDSAEVALRISQLYRKHRSQLSQLLNAIPDSPSPAIMED